MYNLLHIYDCSKCGKILSDEVIFGEVVDTERDEIIPYAKCVNCGGEAIERIKDGMQCYEEVDEERARWANGFYDENEDDNEYNINDNDY